MLRCLLVVVSVTAASRSHVESSAGPNALVHIFEDALEQDTLSQLRQELGVVFAKGVCTLHSFKLGLCQTNNSMMRAH